MRIKGIVVEDPRPGKFYLLHRAPENGSDSYHLRDAPGRTNDSHKEKFFGWLGTTNNIAWYADEAIELTKDGHGRWQYRRFKAAELVASEEARECY
jgi:hypothetical protein